MGCADASVARASAAATSLVATAGSAATSSARMPPPMLCPVGGASVIGDSEPSGRLALANVEGACSGRMAGPSSAIARWVSAAAEATCLLGRAAAATRVCPGVRWATLCLAAASGCSWAYVSSGVAGGSALGAEAGATSVAVACSVPAVVFPGARRSPILRSTVALASRGSTADGALAMDDAEAWSCVAVFWPAVFTPSVARPAAEVASLVGTTASATGGSSAVPCSVLRAAAASGCSRAYVSSGRGGTSASGDGAGASAGGAWSFVSNS